MPWWKLAHLPMCRLYASVNRVSIDSDNGLSPNKIIINWTLRNKLQWNFYQTTNIFIQENAYENVVSETAAIWSWGDEWRKYPYQMILWNVLHNHWYEGHANRRQTFLHIVFATFVQMTHLLKISLHCRELLGLVIQHKIYLWQSWWLLHGNMEWPPNFSLQ